MGPVSSAFLVAFAPPLGVAVALVAGWNLFKNLVWHS